LIQEFGYQEGKEFSFEVYGHSYKLRASGGYLAEIKKGTEVWQVIRYTYPVHITIFTKKDKRTDDAMNSKEIKAVGSRIIQSPLIRNAIRRIDRNGEFLKLFQWALESPQNLPPWMLTEFEKTIQLPTGEALKDMDAQLGIENLDNREGLEIIRHGSISTRELFLEPSQGRREDLMQALASFGSIKAAIEGGWDTDEVVRKMITTVVPKFYTLLFALEQLGIGDNPLFDAQDARGQGPYYQYLESLGNNPISQRVIYDFVSFADLLVEMLLKIDLTKEHQSIDAEMIRQALATNKMVRESIINYVGLVDTLKRNLTAWREAFEKYGDDDALKSYRILKEAIAKVSQKPLIIYVDDDSTARADFEGAVEKLQDKYDFKIFEKQEEALAYIKSISGEVNLVIADTFNKSRLVGPFFAASLQQLFPKIPFVGVSSSGSVEYYRQRGLEVPFYQKPLFGTLKFWKPIILQHASDPASKDGAMAHKTDTGGIDLNPAQMSMQIKKQGEDFKFDFDGTQIDAAQVIGATFTIRQMTPVTDLPQIFGLKSV